MEIENKIRDKKNYNMALTETMEKQQHYHRVKLIDMNIFR